MVLYDVENIVIWIMLSFGDKLYDKFNIGFFLELL